MREVKSSLLEVVVANDGCQEYKLELKSYCFKFTY